MSKSEKLLIIVFSAVMLLMLASLGRLAIVRHNIKTSESDEAVVRLYRPVPGGGMILCSGTVVSDTHIITAAHCLAPTEMDTVAPILEIRRYDDIPTGIPAQIEAFDPRTDLGVLTGDFSTLAKKTAVSGAAEINEAFKSSDSRVRICGYPHGGRLTCSDVTKAKNSFFKFSTLGFAYPGMSGGSVIDLNTGKLIAVISAVEDDRVILSPLIEVWRDLHIEEGK